MGTDDPLVPLDGLRKPMVRVVQISEGFLRGTVAMVRSQAIKVHLQIRLLPLTVAHSKRSLRHCIVEFGRPVIVLHGALFVLLDPDPMIE